MVHCPGTRPPNTPVAPEEARMDAYLPMSVIDELPVRVAVARIVQLFAEDVAVRLMARWDHAKGLQQMKRILTQVDLIFECRDYRVPLTSRNPMFEETLAGKTRVVVYTKKDLGVENEGEVVKKVILII